MKSFWGWIVCAGLVLSACNQGDNTTPAGGPQDPGLSGQSPYTFHTPETITGTTTTNTPGSPDLSGAGAGGSNPPDGTNVDVNAAQPPQPQQPPGQQPPANAPKDETCLDVTDSNLHDAIRAALGLTDPNKVITKVDAEALEALSLQAYVVGVKSLAGIGCLTKLFFITLDGSSLVDFQPLSTLPNLHMISMKNQKVPVGGTLDISSLTKTLQSKAGPYAVYLEGNKVDACDIQKLTSGLVKDANGTPTAGVIVQNPDQFGTCATANPPAAPDPNPIDPNQSPPYQFIMDLNNLQIVKTGLLITLLPPKDWPAECVSKNGAVNVNDVSAVIPDKALVAAIKQQLNLKDTDPITYLDSIGLVTLSAPKAGITDTGGLQCFTNLKTIDLSGNTGISDIDPLIKDAYLTKSKGSVNLKGDYNVALWQIKKLQANNVTVVYDQYAPWLEPYVGTSAWLTYSVTLALDTSTLKGGVSFRGLLEFPPKTSIKSAELKTVKKGDKTVTFTFSSASCGADSLKELRNATLNVTEKNFKSGSMDETLSIIGVKAVATMFDGKTETVFWNPCANATIGQWGVGINTDPLSLKTDAVGYCVTGETSDKKSYPFVIDFVTSQQKLNFGTNTHPSPKDNPMVTRWTNTIPLGEAPKFKLSESQSQKSTINIKNLQIWAFRPAYPEFIKDDACYVSGGLFSPTISFKEPYFPDSHMGASDMDKGYWLMKHGDDPGAKSQCPKVKDLTKF